MDTSVLKKAKDQNRVGINERFKWVRFVDENEDGEPYTINCRVRTSLVNAEVDELIKIESERKNNKMWEAIHSYVVEWDVVYRDADGDLYEVMAPSEGGAVSFQFAPSDLGWAIVGAIIKEVFHKVDPKSLKSAESTDDN